MMCAWNALLAILPLRIREEVDRLGKTRLQEIRLRVNSPPELLLGDDRIWLKDAISIDDLTFVINMATQYSPWTASSVSKGYLSVSGGHRIGICGEVVLKDGEVTTMRQVHSLCIRVARDFPGIAKTLQSLPGTTLILGAPGWGKTTLLRDLIRQIASSQTVAVVDERGELFPEGFQQGNQMDVLSGCPKGRGIEMLLRTMSPEWIAVDEITAEEDCRALIQAANCGVGLLATAHAASKEEFHSRKVYSLLIEQKIVNTLVILSKDRSFITERMTL